MPNRQRSLGESGHISGPVAHRSCVDGVTIFGRKSRTGKGQEGFPTSPRLVAGVLCRLLRLCGSWAAVLLSTRVSSTGRGKSLGEVIPKRLVLFFVTSFPEEVTKGLSLSRAVCQRSPPHWLPSTHVLAPASTSTSFLGAFVEQTISTPRVGFVVFIQIVKISTAVGRGRTAGSDSFPPVS